MSVTLEYFGRDHQEREQPRNIPASVRQAVLDRDDAQCQLCGDAGSNKLQLHHLELRSQGGTHVAENLITLCFRCHGDVHAGRQDVALYEVAPGVFAAFPAVPLGRPHPRTPPATA